MNCDWDGLLALLPLWLRQEVDLRKQEQVQEIRLRVNQPTELILKNKIIWLQAVSRQPDLDFCINAASRYSPWAATTAAAGYLTASGGHRVGMCGEVITKGGAVTGLRNIRSLCIRVARDVAGIVNNDPQSGESVLIIGAPGWGKTTLLRDLIRCISRRKTVAVVDERGELFPPGFSSGLQTDILTGCPKPQGILQLLKTMGPQVIAVDEITAPEDCQALLRASCCGVQLLATAHAGNLNELKSRPVYQSILPVFGIIYVLRADQTYQVERMIV